MGNVGGGKAELGPEPGDGRGLRGRVAGTPRHHEGLRPAPPRRHLRIHRRYR